MKIIKLISVVFILVFSTVLTSCPFTLIPSVIQGNLLSVDSDGHLLEDTVYNGGSTTYTYRKDGTYLVQAVDSAGNITGGSQGTYTWDPKTLALVLSYTKYWSTSSNSWLNYTDAKTETLVYYFSSQRLGYAYKLVENTENTFTFESATVNENGNTITWTITVEIRTSSFIYDETYTVDDNSGTRTYGEDVHVEGTVDALYPEGVRWAAGNTVTVSITQTSGQTRSWDTGAAAWGSWSAMTYFEKELRTYSHMGSYVISLSGSDWVPLR